jgi:hypothetical protein
MECGGSAVLSLSLVLLVKKKVNKWLLLLATLFESEFEQTQRICCLSGQGFGVTEHQN